MSRNKGNEASAADSIEGTPLPLKKESLYK